MGEVTDFKIEQNEQVGRYAVAKKTLSPGDFIFEEQPLAVGPKTDSSPLCLGCLSPVDCTTLCTKCSWPVCNLRCQNSSVHTQNECPVFSRAGAKFQPVEDPSQVSLQYECVTPLRLLLAKEREPLRWQQEVEPMKDHTDSRRDKPIWDFEEVNIAEYLRRACKLDRWSSDLVHRACGLLEVNAFEARTPRGYPIRCLYPQLAILSHNCVSNIHHTIRPEDFRVTVRASTEVAEGHQLYSSYTYSLWPTLTRREYLLESKYFECQCKRCCDKSELGTHLGTLKCTRCDNGLIESSDPLSDSCSWRCSRCDFETTALAVRKVYSTIQEEIDALDLVSGSQGVERREATIRKYRSVLHPRHSFMILLKMALTQLYGSAEDYLLEDLPDILLERKVEMCREILGVLDVVEPGHSRIRGVTLFELHAATIVLARNGYGSGGIGREEFRGRMEEAVDVLRGAVEILRNEAKGSMEGQLGEVATLALENLTNNFETLIETA